MEKFCFKCGRLLPLSEFYVHSKMKDGHLNKCKECTKKDSRSNRAKNVDYYREYDRVGRKNIEERRAALRSRLSRYQTPEKRRETLSKYNRDHPDRYKAHWLVREAIKKGNLKRMPCSVCGSSEKVEAHHPDYSKPLDVVWLCEKCHKTEHASIRASRGESIDAPWVKLYAR